MIRLYDFDEVKPEEILNRDIRAEADVEATVDAIIADVRARPKSTRPFPNWKPATRNLLPR